MKIIVIGAVAAGTSAAAKARRNNEDAEIVIYEKNNYFSYSGCGMPYYIGGEVESADELIPRAPAFFKSKYNVDIFISHEVLAISSDEKSVTFKELEQTNTRVCAGKGAPNCSIFNIYQENYRNYFTI